MTRETFAPGGAGGLGKGFDPDHLPPGEADIRTAEKAVRALSYDLFDGGVRRVAEIVGRLSSSWRRGLVLLDRRDRDQTGRYQRLQLLLPMGVSVAAQVDRGTSAELRRRRDASRSSPPASLRSCGHPPSADYRTRGAATAQQHKRPWSADSLGIPPIIAQVAHKLSGH